MLLPVELQAAVEHAIRAVQLDARHELRPYYRRMIYDALGPPDASHTWGTRAILASRVIQRILPYWEATRSADLRPQRLLQTIEGISQGQVTFRTAQALALTAREEIIYQLEYLPDEWDALDLRQQCILLASIAGLQEACGLLHMPEVGQEYPDAELDEHDAAYWGICAEIGEEWDSLKSHRQSLAFWEWWLSEAVGSAWERATSPDFLVLDNQDIVEWKGLI